MKKNEYTALALFVKQKRKQTDITQLELADKAGVGIRFVRDEGQALAIIRTSDKSAVK